MLFYAGIVSMALAMWGCCFQGFVKDVFYVLLGRFLA